MTFSVRAEELGIELRGLRESAGLSLELAGECIGASATKLSRIERGIRDGSIEDISGLLAVYRCTGAKRDELLRMAHDMERLGWWQRNKPGFAERQRTLMNLEERADLIITFDIINMPGKLQTSEHMFALMRESDIVPANEVDGRVLHRIQRQAVLQRDNPPKLIAIVDELVLHRLIGGPQVLRRQLAHLEEAAQKPNIKLRILPNTRAHAGIPGPFELIRREGGHRVVFLENYTSSLFLEDPVEIDAYSRVVRVLLSQALSAEESLRLITELRSTE